MRSRRGARRQGAAKRKRVSGRGAGRRGGGGRQSGGGCGGLALAVERTPTKKMGRAASQGQPQNQASPTQVDTAQWSTCVQGGAWRGPCRLSLDSGSPLSSMSSCGSSSSRMRPRKLLLDCGDWERLQATALRDSWTTLEREARRNLKESRRPVGLSESQSQAAVGVDASRIATSRARVGPASEDGAFQESLRYARRRGQSWSERG